MMRGGGSIVAKYCRKPGSRQCSSSSNQNRGRSSLETVEEPRKILGWGWPSFILYGVETVAYKALLVYVGYKLAVVGSPYDPEKSTSEIEALRERNQLLEKKQALLAEAGRMEISN